MTVGAQAPAPMGYLEFCARRPEQCGLGQAADTHGAVIDTELRAQDLRRRYYWSIVLAGSPTFVPQQSPAYGAGALPLSASSQSRWNSDKSGALDLPLDATAPQLEPATWRGSRNTLFQTTVLQTRGNSAPGYVTTSPVPTLSDPLPAPSGKIADPFSLNDADADPLRNVEPLTLTPPVMQQLNTVNRDVNESIHYAPARVLYGSDDYWTLPLEPGGLRAGDCKDYVLEKRKALVDQGVPAADLSIAVVMLRTGITHAVLLVATDHGELVMDSLSSWVTPWNELDYRWISRQAPGQQLVWVKVEPMGRG